MSDQMMLRATLDIIMLCEQRYQSRLEIYNQPGPRIVCIEIAIHTWVLDFAGNIPSKHMRWDSARCILPISGLARSYQTDNLFQTLVTYSRYVIRRVSVLWQHDAATARNDKQTY